MKHYMNLNPVPFEMIRSGKKTIELRLNDEKRRAISVGDTIVFTNTQDSGRQISATVTALHKFRNFAELYSKLPLLKCGYTEEDIGSAKPEDMNVYYSKELEEKYGVLGIELSVDYTIDNCKGNDVDYICDRLVEYNLSRAPATQEILFENINKKFLNANGEIIAGCVARMYCWNVLYIDILWVDKNYRHQGLGSKLLEYVEDTAKAKGCYLIHLDTFDFQAKDFYLKHGYEIFGTLKDCPKDHCRYYLQKRIQY